MTIPRNQADPGPSGGYRDQILHANPSPDGQAFLGDLRGFSRVADSQDVQDVQAPGAYSVTSGHGECECSDCDGWTYAWSEWAANR